MWPLGTVGDDQEGSSSTLSLGDKLALKTMSHETCNIPNKLKSELTVCKFAVHYTHVHRSVEKP